MLVVNRRVRDGIATPAEEAAWRRWMGLDRCGFPRPLASGRRLFDAARAWEVQLRRFSGR